MKENKTYLGDGAYLEFSGYDFILTTSDGLFDTNKIHLEPIAIERLINFYKMKMKRESNEQSNITNTKHQESN